MTTAPHRAYATRTAAFMAGYVALNVALITGAFDDISRPGAYVLALAVTGPVIGQIWATLDFMRRSDEYIGGLLARRFIIASGLTFAVATGWGFLETFAGLPHVPGWMVYPVFWALFGVVSPFVRSTG